VRTFARLNYQRTLSEDNWVEVLGFVIGKDEATYALVLNEEKIEEYRLRELYDVKRTS
jgi:hypothetical protein